MRNYKKNVKNIERTEQKLKSNYKLVFIFYGLTRCTVYITIRNRDAISLKSKYNALKVWHKN